VKSGYPFDGAGEDQRSTSIDDKFRFEIDRRPERPLGRNHRLHYYRHSISGRFLRLPVDGGFARPGFTGSGRTTAALHVRSRFRRAGGKKYFVGGSITGRRFGRFTPRGSLSTAHPDLTVINGGGSGNYPPGTQVTVTANPLTPTGSSMAGPAISIWPIRRHR
jgi:hypothetical protein